MTLIPEEIARLKSLMLRYEDIKRPPGVATELLSLAIEMLPSLIAAAERCGERRCENCNGELSACGEMTADGPSMDCRTCQYNDSLQDTKNMLQSAESRATQAEARVRELMALAESQAKVIKTSGGVMELFGREMVHKDARILELTTRLAAARTAFAGSNPAV